MSYEPTQWNSGDVVTSAKLNNLENGVQEALAGGSGGGALVCTADNNGVLYHTWQEIHDAAPLVWLFDGENFAALSSIASSESEYYVGFYDAMGSVAYDCISSSADGYPVISHD